MTDLKTIAEAEKICIVAALTYYQGNMTHAAKYLGCARATLYRKCLKHQIEVKNVR